MATTIPDVAADTSNVPSRQREHCHADEAHIYCEEARRDRSGRAEV